MNPLQGGTTPLWIHTESKKPPFPPGAAPIKECYAYKAPLRAKGT